MPPRRLLALYGIWMAALIALYYALPSLGLMTWSAVGLSGAVAIAYGVRRYQPRRKVPWLLIALAVLLSWAGNTLYTLLAAAWQRDPFPSVADLLYLAMIPMLIAGVMGLSKAAAAGRDRTIALDALILAASLSLLWWIFLISPNLLAADRTMAERLVAIAYPIGDIVILAAIGRLVAVTRRPSPTVMLLTVGTVGLLAADVLYGLIELHGVWSEPNPVALGWMIFYACFGAAALHPSMAELTEPRVFRPHGISQLRQAVLLLFSLLPPVVLLAEAARGRVQHAMAIGACSIVITVLVLARLYGVVNIYRRSTVRAGRLRDTNAALLSATDVPGVIWALRRMVDKLLAADTPHNFMVIMDDGSVPEVFDGLPAQGGAQLRYTNSLAPQVAEQLAPFEMTLMCALELDDRPIGEPRIGVLLVSADQVSLSFLQVPLEVAASHAALAIERITLSQEVLRRNSEQYFRTLVQNTNDVILIVDADSEQIRYASPSAVSVFGSSELEGRNLRALIDGEHSKGPLDVLGLTRSGDAVTADWIIVRPDGSSVQTEVSCRDLRNEPTVAGLVVTLRDVTARRGLEAELTHRAYHDALTGLANRLRFQERMGEALKRAHQTGTVSGVLFIDLDDFKVVNDTLGHESGDELLRTVAGRLTAALRPDDIAARLGGDEFAVLIEDVADAGAVEEVATRISALLAEPFTVAGRKVHETASIGVATSADAVTGPDLLRQADLALYVAKGAGKGQWRRYQPALHMAIVRRLELRTALDQAVTEGQFTLDYQPIVALRSGVTAGFEALLRWNHPTRGRLLPDQFIEVAEESGLIVPIGQWVLTEAVAAAAKWRESPGAYDSPYISINVSARQFRSPGFVQSVQDALAAVGLPAYQLMLEITESLLLRDDDQVWEDLAVLREIGVRVAIDDFGTGYSSLSYLRHLPLDVIKIDRLFTGTITSSRQQAALVDAIVTLARTLGLEVVAEGIESAAERDLLARMGCPYGQGFLFARPMPLDDAMRWITAERVSV